MKGLNNYDGLSFCLNATFSSTMDSFRLRYPPVSPFKYKEPLNMKKLWAERFKEFCDQTSLHGWSYLEKGETMKILTILKRILWSCVIIGSAIACGLFVVKRIIEYVESDVVIRTESRSESLSEIYFPSVVICNINPLRKSFMYEVLQNTTISNNKTKITHLWNDIIKTYFSGIDQSEWSPPAQELEQMMKEFRTSPKYIELARLFLEQEVNETTFTNKHNTTEIFYSHGLIDDEYQIKETLLQDPTLFKLLPHLSRQYQLNDMILDIDWLGSDLGVYYEPSFGTDFGICDWITPNVESFDLNDTTHGSETGTLNGLTLLLDAETFDYGFTTKSSGFKISLSYHLDMPIISQTGVNVSPGTHVQIAVTPSLINITEDAKELSPQKRKCYMAHEVLLDNLPTDLGYRYQV